MLAATSINPIVMRTVVSALLVAFLAGDDMAAALKSEPAAGTTVRLPRSHGISETP